MRINITPGDLLIARRSHLADYGMPSAVVEIKRNDRLLVVSAVAAAPAIGAEVYVEDPELLEACYPDKYYVTALWRERLVETVIMTDEPFCEVIRG